MMWNIESKTKEHKFLLVKITTGRVILSSNALIEYSL